MNRRCREIQSILAEAGPPALRDDAAARQHLVECEACYAFVEALGELDAALGALPALDAPDAAVEGVLRRTQSPPPRPAQTSARGRGRRGPERRRRPLAWLARPWVALPVAVAGLAVVLTSRLGTDVFRGPDPAPVFETRVAKNAELAERALREPAPKDADVKRRARLRTESLRGLGYLDPESGAGAEAPDSLRPEAQANERKRQAAPETTRLLAELDAQLALGRSQRWNEAFGYLGGAAGAKGDDLANAPVPESVDELRPGRAGVRRYVDVGRLQKKEAYRDGTVTGALASELEESVRREPGVPASPPADPRGDRAKLRSAPRLEGAADRPAETFADREAAGRDAFAFDAELAASALQRFQRERSSVEGVAFQPASGYWANTYVPGDPALRWLQSRLERRDPALLQAASVRPIVLDAAARQTTQHFDAPRQSALDVFLHADRRGAEGAARTLVQVGVRATERPAGLRPAMNVGIVLDLRGALPAETAASMRALVEAFEDAKDTGDRFRLIAAGRPGGTVVDADAFRHGPIQLALSALFEGGARGETLGLVEALETAVRATRQSDDPTAPLGSSLVVLVTGQRLAALEEPVAQIAHHAAVAGVPVSVVGIGDGADAGEIERVTLAGQGNRRLLATAREAEGAVARELAAQSRVVARAVRLRIRLAPGAKLVEVVGAERLDASGAQQVRRAERSIDARLARNLGIEADRGSDEDGIQIVIPAFYSGDAHVVVLDVVAPGPGPVADVTVRYKDLVHLRNGVARASLTLGGEAAPPGPLERNVVKNLLAIRLAETLKQAGRELLAGQDAAAIARVRDFQALLAGLDRAMPGFQGDPDLATDRAMLGEYLALLEPRLLQQPEPRQYLAESLQLAGYLKTLPRVAAE